MGNKMILWDFGNVIAAFSVDRFLEDVASLFSVTPFEVIAFMEGPMPDSTKQFIHVIEGDSHWNTHRIFLAFCSRFGKKCEYEMFEKIFSNALREDYEHSGRFLKFSRRIHGAGYYQGLISNANAIHAKKMEYELGHLLAYISKEFRYYSWSMCLRKSESPVLFNKVFGEIESKLEIKRADMVFIDDRPENIEGCKAAGAHAIEFNIGDGLYRLEEKLARLGFSL